MRKYILYRVAQILVIIVVCSLSLYCNNNVYCAGDTLNTSVNTINSDSLSTINDTTSINYKPQFIPEIFIHKVKDNSIIVDGKLDDEGWKNAAVAKNFVEISPRDNGKPNADTKVLVAYDDDNLFLAVINYEPDMSSVRANVCDRDKIYSDDFCGLMLDTYGDSKQAYEIYCNPYGIQGDLLEEVSGNEDSNFDLIYESEAKMYKDKWIAEFKIPFKIVLSLIL